MSRTGLLGYKPSRIGSYGIVLLSIGVALIISRWAYVQLKVSPGAFFICAVMLSAWFGGVWPGLLAAGLATFAFHYYFLPPTHALGLRPAELAKLLPFMLTTNLVALLSAAQRSAKEAVRRTSDELKETVQNLMRTNEALHSESREREQAEKRMGRSEAYLAEAQTLTKTGSWAYDPTTNKAPHWSDEMFRIHGLEPQQGPPTSAEFLKHVHQEDRQRVHDAMSNAVQKKGEYDIQYRMILRDGTIAHIHALGHLVLNSSGDVVEVVGSAVDITERKMAEAALRRSEAYLAQAQEISRTGSFGWVVSSGDIYWSPETFRIFQFDPTGKVTLGMILERTHPEDRTAVQQFLERVSQQSAAFDFDHRLLMPDGSVKYIHIVGRPSENESGIPEFVGAVTDVSERKRAEQERERFRQLEADLAHTNRVSMMGELAAGLAHEIKQPITAVITDAYTSLRWLARDKPDLQEAREAIMRTANDAKRAAEIIQRLRSFYRKGSPPEPELVDLNEVAREMVALLRDEASRYSISMRTNLSGDLLKITADRVQLQQVLMNLMLNGLEAMKGTGGVLTVKSQLDQDGRVQISVSDTGVGLPTENADQIFNAFFTTKPQGSGMGLAISRSIVESHGGRLWATPNDGRGASFHFSLATTTASAETHARAS
jgi:PAS domain S-box-containing protein